MHEGSIFGLAMVMIGLMLREVEDLDVFLCFYFSSHIYAQGLFACKYRVDLFSPAYSDCYSGRLKIEGTHDAGQNLDFCTSASS